LAIFTGINGTAGRNGTAGTMEIIVGLCIVDGGVEKVL